MYFRALFRPGVFCHQSQEPNGFDVVVLQLTFLSAGTFHSCSVGPDVDDPVGVRQPVSLFKSRMSSHQPVLML